jgi:hypothetical protein
MSDIFISYSKTDHALASKLSGDHEATGRSEGGNHNMVPEHVQGKVPRRYGAQVTADGVRPTLKLSKPIG